MVDRWGISRQPCVLLRRSTLHFGFFCRLDGHVPGTPASIINGCPCQRHETCSLLRDLEQDPDIVKDFVARHLILGRLYPEYFLIYLALIPLQQQLLLHWVMTGDHKLLAIASGYGRPPTCDFRDHLFQV